jgi:hypothetical protein
MLTLEKEEGLSIIMSYYEVALENLPRLIPAEMI